MVEFIETPTELTTKVKHTCQTCDKPPVLQQSVWESLLVCATCGQYYTLSGEPSVWQPSHSPDRMYSLHHLRGMAVSAAPAASATTNLIDPLIAFIRSLVDYNADTHIDRLHAGLKSNHAYQLLRSLAFADPAVREAEARPTRPPVNQPPLPEPLLIMDSEPTTQPAHKSTPKPASAPQKHNGQPDLPLVLMDADADEPELEEDTDVIIM